MAPDPTTAAPPLGKSGARRVAANSVWQMVSFAARAIAGLGSVVLLARSGGPEGLGTFQFALVLTTSEKVRTISVVSIDTRHERHLSDIF